MKTASVSAIALTDFSDQGSNNREDIDGGQNKLPPSAGRQV
jgi:hypothetical protein